MTTQIQNDDPMIGCIFEHHGHDGIHLWKVTGPARASFGRFGDVYPVVMCNKNGKEFKKTTAFDVDFVKKVPKTRAVTDEKVSQAGIEPGVRKRRILFLESEIRSMQAELEKLKNEE